METATASEEKATTGKAQIEELELWRWRESKKTCNFIIFILK
jgi:hypothetical protein